MQTANSGRQAPVLGHQIWSLWDMIQLEIKPFMDAQDLLVQWSVLLHNDPRYKNSVNNGLRQQFGEQIRPLMEQLEIHDFDMCRLGFERFLGTLERTARSPEIVSEVDDLRRRMLDQASAIYCLSLSKRERDFYEPKSPLFGDEVEAKFPMMSEDISEAAKCLALNRPTATVFHLMRVMEIGVRRFGDVLGVQLVDEKNWQNILDEINKAIQKLDQKATLTKRYAGVSAHLYNVKIASRNEVMHPKQTYTLDEAVKVFNATDAFIRDLAALI